MEPPDARASRPAEKPEQACGNRLAQGSSLNYPTALARLMERRGRGRRSREAEQIAHERMEILFAQAHLAVVAGNEARAKRYVFLARRIGMRYNVPVPRQQRRWVCRGCWTFMVPGHNCSTRLRPGRIVIRCLRCGRVKRLGRGPKRAAKRGKLE